MEKGKIIESLKCKRLHHLAVGLGICAVELIFSVIYSRMEELLQLLKRKTDILVPKQRHRAYSKNVLVVPDKLGYQVLDRREAHLFFQFISARYMKSSQNITGNRFVWDWIHIFADDEMATTAILDRLLHKDHIINIDE